MTEATRTHADFTSSIIASIDLISHVWKQINALKNKLDIELPNLSGDFVSRIELDKEHEATDSTATDDVSTAWLWRYKVSYSTPKQKGRKKKAFLYAVSRIYPMNEDAKKKGFDPFLIIYLERSDCELGLSDFYDSPDDDYHRKQIVDGESQLVDDRNLFKDLYNARVYEYFEDRENIGVGLFVPLLSLNSNNLDAGLIHPLRELIESHVEKWANDRN
ncbi:hypothetical protein DWU98_09540 [Dyella monticola]|uniref:Uncharacterized protein n=1 Tax=Dyella monticola TaxID=1927958 RepID=A0A370X1H5_9GAMM|nr:hypothetical protein [Dyella monticola]RDS82263.1 hypothetical protein DWU98_09540 [Dyella monticola]